MYSNGHGTRGLIASTAGLPERLSIEVERAEKRRFHSAGVGRKMPPAWSAVVATIHEQVTPSIAVEIANPYIATERTAFYRNEERIWHGDFAIQQGILTRWSVLDSRIGSPNWVGACCMADDGEREARNNG